MALEQGEWAQVSAIADELGIEGPTLSRLYGESVRWVDQIFAGALKEAA